MSKYWVKRLCGHEEQIEIKKKRKYVDTVMNLRNILIMKKSAKKYGV